MSKVTRLEQLENENSIYRVSGVFDKSQVCEVGYRVVQEDYVVMTCLKPFEHVYIEPAKLQAALSNGSISIMCLQRGDYDE